MYLRDWQLLKKSTVSWSEVVCLSFEIMELGNDFGYTSRSWTRDWTKYCFYKEQING
jgi:hypothetical protein